LIPGIARGITRMKALNNTLTINHTGILPQFNIFIKVKRFLLINASCFLENNLCVCQLLQEGRFLPDKQSQRQNPRLPRFGILPRLAITSMWQLGLIIKYTNQSLENPWKIVSFFLKLSKQATYWQIEKLPARFMIFCPTDHILYLNALT